MKGHCDLGFGVKLHPEATATGNCRLQRPTVKITLAGVLRRLERQRQATEGTKTEKGGAFQAIWQCRQP